jgi:DNA-binding NarL/FixJ family response regulator
MASRPPHPLNLDKEIRVLAGLGSYIVNAQGDSNSCHNAGPATELARESRFRTLLPVVRGGLVLPGGYLSRLEVDRPSYVSQAINSLPARDHSQDGKLRASRHSVDRSGIELVSRRQLRVIELVARGYKNKEVAKELRIGESVVRNYLREIYEKIGVSNRLELALWYWSRRQEGKPLRPSE